MADPKSVELFERAVKVIPGGVNSPVRAFRAVGGSPVFVSRAEGAYLYGADGAKYTDYIGSWGPMIVGHAHPAVLAAYAALYGSAWIAEAGVHVDMSSPLYPVIGHANASRLPYLPMILRPDELESGRIDHMLGIVIAKDHGIGYAWPARSGDGDGSNPNGVPMGTVFRLSADFDISGYAPATQVVLRALQQHGAVVYDSMGPGIDGAGLLAMSNGWSGTDYVTARTQLNSVPMSAFEAVDVSGIAVDPMVGWQIFEVAV